jgi:hypothetical protein
MSYAELVDELSAILAAVKMKQNQPINKTPEEFLLKRIEEHLKASTELMVELALPGRKIP